MDRVRWRLLALSFSFMNGCVTFHPKGIEPQQTAAQFEARTLTDARLESFISANAQRSLPWPPASWNFSLLTLAAFYYHADLDVARAQWQVARAGIQTAKERPNPNFSVGPEYAANPEPGFASWILGFSLDIPIETAGKRGYRITQSNAITEASRWHLVKTAWLVRSRVRAALLAVYAAQATRTILQSQALKLNENRRLYKKRSAEGYVSPLTYAQAAVLVGKTDLLLADAQRQGVDARHQLSQSLGVSIHALDGISLDFTRFEQPTFINQDAFAALRGEALLKRSDLREVLALYAASQAALQLEIAKQTPDVHLGPGYLYDQGTRKWGLAASSVLPILNQNHGAIAEASARRDQAAAQFMALQEGVIGDIDRALADCVEAQQKLQTATALLATQTEEEERLQKILSPGDIRRLTLFRSGLDLDSTRLLATEARVQFNQAQGALEDALEKPLPETLESLPSVEKNPRDSRKEPYAL